MQLYCLAFILATELLLVQIDKIDDSIINPVFLELLIRNCPDYFFSLIKSGAREGQVLDKEELSKN